MSVRKITVTCLNEADRKASQLFIDQMYAGNSHAAFNEIEGNRRVSLTCRSACKSVGVRNLQDHDDIAQKTLIELFLSAWTRYDGTCSIFTYVYTIARRRALDLVRQRISQIDKVSEGLFAGAEVDGDEARSGSSAAGDNVNGDGSGSEHRLCAMMALDELQATEPRWWEILSTWVLSTESVESLAESFGVTDGSLKNLITKIKRYLAELCAKHCGTPDCSAAVAG